MTVKCYFCGGDCNPYDEGNYLQVTGWVKSPKKDSMVLREYTGPGAHGVCVDKAAMGQAPDQGELPLG